MALLNPYKSHGNVFPMFIDKLIIAQVSSHLQDIPFKIFMKGVKMSKKKEFIEGIDYVITPEFFSFLNKKEP